MSYNFDAVKVRDNIVDWLKTIGESEHFDRVVIGISGGKDSAVAAALCCRAFGHENVYGLLMPNQVQHDIKDSIEVCDALDIKYNIINIGGLYNQFIRTYVVDFNLDGEGELTEQAKINLAPRIRMVMLRLFGQNTHSRVCGTGNLSEIILGYCTKDGDNRSDFNPIGGLTSLEVVEVGKTMPELPIEIIEKAPADGLTGKTDEENLGVTYDDVHKYIRSLPGLDNATWYKIEHMERANLHKRNIMTFLPEV